MMKKFLLGTVGLVALGMAAPASAADYAARPYSKAPPQYIEPMYNWSGFYIGINGGWGQSGDATGGTVGGQIGYNWQAGSWVFGVEAQGNWADLSNSDPFNLDWSEKVDGFGLFTGRVGYAWNNTLLYAKGGAAVVSNEHWTAFNNATDTRWGADIGVGFEFGFAPNWSFGVEYNHVFLDNSNWAVQNWRNTNDLDLVTARINYRFGGPVVAKY
jgi:outer membrane immunogenic protein